MRKRFWPSFVVILLIVAAAAVLSICLGPVKIPVRDVLSTITNKKSGDNATGNLYQAVLFSVRLPRTTAALLVGWALALSGLCYQSLLKNPLASEYTLGIASGAAIGAVLSVLMHIKFPFSTFLFAFLGSVLTMVVLFLIARSRNLFDTYSLVLTGIIFSAFGNAVLSLMLSIASPNQLHAFYFWFMGSFASAQWSSLFFVGPIIVVLSLVIFLLSWDMNAISVGEEFAQQVGVPVVRSKLILYFTSSLLTALSVSIAGTIGFIGLVIPHLGRLILGVDNRSLVLIVPLLGATFCIVSDLIARLVLSPAELPVGVVTAFVGVPVFIYFLSRRQS
jgi:iron complex transport system permease protein